MSLPIIGIVGNNASGKTMLMKAVCRSISASGRDMCFLDWNNVNATVEVDLGSAIATCVIERGKVKQKLVGLDMKIDYPNLQDGGMFYEYGMRAYISHINITELSFAETVIKPILEDLYKGKVRNSIIWVDDFARGLDDFVARDFLQVLTKKSLEGDNQLIVSCERESLVAGMGSESLRPLRSSSEGLVSSVLKRL
jgi:nicotinamide riboside kinase